MYFTGAISLFIAYLVAKAAKIGPLQTFVHGGIIFSLSFSFVYMCVTQAGIANTYIKHYKPLSMMSSIRDSSQWTFPPPSK